MDALNIYAITALINVVSSVVLGILVFSADKSARVNQMFGVFSCAIAFWSYAYFSWQIAPSAQGALYWTHILMIGAAFITPTYFHFSAVFLGVDKKYWPLIVSGYLFIAAFLILNGNPSFILDVHSIAGFPFWPEAGPLFLPFIALWVGYAILPVILFVQALMHSAEARHSSAIRYMLSGTLIGYLGGCTNYFLWYGIPIPPWGNISATIYLALVAYAIMKYGLFNMKIIATELLTFMLWLFIFIRLLLSKGSEDVLVNGLLLFAALIVGVLLIRSVDKEIKQRELIEKQAQELEAVNQQQTSLMHFISHEIKGYLTKSQAGFAAIAQGDFGPVSPDIANLANTALIDVRKGAHMVMDILDASNLKNGTVTFSKKTFDMKGPVQAVLDQLKGDIEEKHLALQTDIAWESPCLVLADEEKVRDHVIRNLVDNAIKYTPSGSIRIELRRTGNLVRFAVQDSGIGITDEDKARLFTEGGHGKDSIKINVHSTGYGLFIAKSIVEAQGGKIWAESAGAGKGSRFVVELPAV